MSRRVFGLVLVGLAAAGAGALLLELRDERRARRRDDRFAGMRR